MIRIKPVGDPAKQPKVAPERPAPSSKPKQRCGFCRKVRAVMSKMWRTR